MNRDKLVKKQITKLVKLWKDLEARNVETIVLDYLMENPHADISHIEIVCQETIGKEDGHYVNTRTYFVREKE